MVSMTSRNPETESTDPDIRMAYQSVTLQGSLNWSVLIPSPGRFNLLTSSKQAHSYLRKGWSLAQLKGRKADVCRLTRHASSGHLR